MGRRRTLGILVAAGLWVLAYAASRAFLESAGTAGWLSADLGYLLPFWAAAALSVRAALRSAKPVRPFWAALAVALVLTSVGDLHWTLTLRLSGAEPPFPSLADAFYLSGYTGVLVAIVLGFRHVPPIRLSRTLIDASVMAAATGLAGFTLLIEPQLHDGASPATLVGIAYPVMDVIMLTMLASFAFAGRARIPRGMLLVAIAWSVAAIADAGYTYLTSIGEYGAGSMLDVGWVIQAVLLCVAALVGARDQAPVVPAARVPRDPGLVPVLVGTALTLAIVTLDGTRGGLSASGVILLVYVVVAVVVRLQLASREQGRIARELEASLAEQERLALTDQLTGLHNRRFFDEAIRMETDRTLRTNRTLGLLVVDLDRFKEVNDRHGHQGGDQVLVEIARRLASSVRSGDVVSRYGGEEFMLLLPEVDSELLLELAERCRRAIGERPFRLGEHTQLTVTASVGGAVMPGDASSGRELIKVADRALYNAKGRGRNRVEIGVEPIVEELEDPFDTSSALLFLETLADQIDGCVASDEHGRAMAEWAGVLAELLGLDRDARRRCVLAARFHDIGKVRVPAAVLSKSGRLDERDWALLREHPNEGARLVGLVPELRDVAPVVRDHHERLDGSGYPAGKHASEIGIEARIVAVCDAWSAMRANRSYRRALSVEEASAELRECSGTQFDPAVVEALLSLVEAGRIDSLARVQTFRHATLNSRAPSELSQSAGEAARFERAVGSLPSPR